MKYLRLIPLVSLAFAAPAYAQEEEGDWTGPYAGVNIGFGTGSSQTDVTLSGAWTSEPTTLQTRVTNDWSNKLKPKGVTFGGQLGYNVQAAPNFVVGVEGDFSISKADDARSFVSSGVPTYTFGNDVDVKNMFSLRAKAGVSTGKTLIFATGGWAWAKSEFGAEVISNGGYTKEGRFKKTTDGFVIGAGVEHKFSPNVSARLDYSYTDQGNVSYPSAYRTGSTFTSPAYNESFNQDLKLHIFRFGINFHF